MSASHIDALERIIETVVAPSAIAVDRDSVYPAAALEALGQAGLLSLASATEFGGGGQDLAAVAQVIERLAGVCGSTAMVVLMHYAAVTVIEAHGSEAVRKAVGIGRHVSTLAFSEAGSRSQFWAPMGTATADGDDGKGAVRLDAHKSWVTAAGHADSCVWSSRPVQAEGAMTLWLVPSAAQGLKVGPAFDGMGLRGNSSTSVTAEGVLVPADAMLGTDGGGMDLAMTLVLPWFLVMSGAFSLGLMEAVTAEATAHLSSTRFEHLDRSLAEQPVARADLARMRLATDTTRCMVNDTVGALGGGRADAGLRVLEVKAVAAEAAIAVTDLAMKVCGGAAFRKELGVERRFRDARAARVMAPTTDALLDFVGRAICGLPLLDPVPA